MIPTVEPRDVVLIGQDIDRRRAPLRWASVPRQPRCPAGRDTRQRHQAERDVEDHAHPHGRHADKTRYPTSTCSLRRQTLPNVLLGELVGIGRSLDRERSTPRAR